MHSYKLNIIVDSNVQSSLNIKVLQIKINYNFLSKLRLDTKSTLRNVVELDKNGMKMFLYNLLVKLRGKYFNLTMKVTFL